MRVRSKARAAPRDNPVTYGPIQIYGGPKKPGTSVSIHVCRNLYFGEPERFDLYNNSKTREAVEKAGKTLDFPAVANRVVDWLYSKRMSIHAAHPEMPFGTRAELQRWRARCAEMFTLALGEKA
jgi:hypothetical protein